VEIVLPLKREPHFRGARGVRNLAFGGLFLETRLGTLPGSIFEPLGAILPPFWGLRRALWLPKLP